MQAQEPHTHTNLISFNHVSSKLSIRLSAVWNPYRKEIGAFEKGFIVLSDCLLA